jgi:hypothetical protein
MGVRYDCQSMINWISKLATQSLIAALLLAGGAMPLAAGASGVTVELKMAAPDQLVASYFLPPGCSELPFDKNGGDGAAIRASWQPLDQCGSAGADALRRKDDACAAVRLRVPASTARRPGYPAAFPLGATLYVHTSNFAVGAQCGPVTYRFIAPEQVALRGRSEARSVEASDGGDMAVLLSSVPLAATPEGIRYYAPGLGADNVARIERVARGTIAYLKSAMPDAPFRMPVLAAGRVEAPGGVGIDGDAADVLRLGLVNWPVQPSQADQEQLTLLVSHEFSHRFQLRDAFDSYPDARLIHEGGAEFLRWVASVQNPAGCRRRRRRACWTMRWPNACWRRGRVRGARWASARSPAAGWRTAAACRPMPMRWRRARAAIRRCSVSAGCIAARRRAGSRILHSRWSAAATPRARRAGCRNCWGGKCRCGARLVRCSTPPRWPIRLPPRRRSAS